MAMGYEVTPIALGDAEDGLPALKEEDSYCRETLKHGFPSSDTDSGGEHEFVVQMR